MMLLILLVNLIYLPALKFGVVNDDATALKLEPYNVKNAKRWSILLHVLVAVYIYIAFKMSIAALIAALLFSVHPEAIQVPVWRAGTHYGINASIFLMILAFAPFLSFLYFFGSLSSATLLFTPFVFLFTKYWYITLVFPLLVLISYDKLKGNLLGKIKGDGAFVTPLPEDFTLHKFHWNKLILVVKTFGYYALICLLPIKNGFYNSFLVTIGTSEKDTKYWYSLNRHFWGGIFAIFSMATIWWFNRFNFIGLGIMLFVTSIAPFLNFITVQQYTAPRYAYLALIGFQVALVGFIFQFPTLVSYPILGALFLYYLDRTLQVMKLYAKDNITLILLDSQVFPENPRLWYYRYEHMLSKGNALMAWAEASYGLKHLPEDCQLYFGLAVASYELGDMNAANEFLKTSERFMIQADRKSMEAVITEMKGRIQAKLKEKWIRGRIN